MQGLKLQMIGSEGNRERLNTGEIHSFEEAYEILRLPLVEEGIPLEILPPALVLVKI